MKEYILETIHNDHKIIFAFDMHGVFLYFDRWLLLKRVVTAPWTFKQLMHFFNPRFYYRAFRIKQTTGVPEQFIIELAHYYPVFKDFIEPFIGFLNAQRVCPLMVSLLAQLSLNHRLILFSNIGQQTFCQLKKVHPELFELFEQHLYAQPADGWIQKPSPEAFKKLIDAARVPADHLLFIDDKRKNEKAARACGISTIRFKGYDAFCRVLKQKNLV